MGAFIELIMAIITMMMNRISEKTKNRTLLLDYRHDF